MIEKNISPKLQSKYRTFDTSSALWTQLKKKYSGSTVLQQSRIVKMVTQTKFSADFDVFIARSDEIQRAFLAAFGTTIDTVQLAEILCIQQLPEEYSEQRILAQSAETLDFSKFTQAIAAKWTDRQHSKKSINLTNPLPSRPTNHTTPSLSS